MTKAHKLTIFTLLMIFALSAGAVFAQNGNAYGQDGDAPVGNFGLAGICRPDSERGEPGEHLSQLLGMDIEEIRDYIQNGGTIEELAEQQGIDFETIREAIHEAHLAELEACLNQAVADGEITQVQADAILEHAQNRPEAGFGPHGEGNGFGEGFGPGEGNRPPRGNRPGRGQRGDGGFGPRAGGPQI